MTTSGPQKVLYLILGILCLVLGIIGLILPIMPGIIFLLGAVYLLSRGSRRVRKFTDEHQGLQKLRARMEQADALSPVDRIKVAALLALDATARALRKVYRWVRGLIA